MGFESQLKIVYDNNAKFDPPDIALTFALVEHGYQATGYEDGKETWFECRDFGDDQDIEAMKEDLEERLRKVVKDFYKKWA